MKDELENRIVFWRRKAIEAANRVGDLEAAIEELICALDIMWNDPDRNNQGEMECHEVNIGAAQESCRQLLLDSRGWWLGTKKQPSIAETYDEWAARQPDFTDPPDSESETPRAGGAGGS